MKPITIIGGGLAGLTLGILLRRENIPAAIIEACRYPRHRVCGEFLSGRGRDIFRALELERKLPTKSEASTSSFHLPNKPPIRFQLQTPALCVSRYDLDFTLAEEFQCLGGILKSGERADAEHPSPGLIRATGRRRAANNAGHLFGLKAHASNMPRSADLEMHFGPNRYVGVCRLSPTESNVCGLFYSPHPQREIQSAWKSIFESSIHTESLAHVCWDDGSFCSIAGLTHDRHFPPNSFSIGDAAAMIPPLTGNGMSMALESAEHAFPIVARYAGDQISWNACVSNHRRAWRQYFSRRLRWAAFIQNLIFHPAGQRILYLGARFLPSLPNLFFSRTR